MKALLLSLVFSIFTHAFNTSFYAHHLSLDDSYELFWNVGETDGKPSMIHLGIIAQTTGWVGFGLSPQGGMPGSDILMAWIDDKQHLQVSDRMARANALPPLDRKQPSDWIGVSGEISNGTTMIEVTRAINTGDEDDVVIQSGLTRVIWSLGDNNETVPYSKHVQRGTSSVVFFGEGIPPPPLNAAKLDLRLGSVHIPNVTTSFFGQVFDLPGDKDYFTIRMDPLISNSHLVHHILVYACPPSPSSTVATLSSGSMKKGCTSLLYAWAVGGPPLILPNQTAIPMKGGSAYMQIHYNNPQHMEGAVDNSGVRFYYTDVRPANEAAFVKLGVPIKDIVIPANNPSYGITNQCNLPNFPGSATVLGSALHMHQIGSQIYSAVYRNKKYVGTVGVNLQWDYNLQQVDMLPTPFTVEGGDVIQTTCVWASGSQEVRGGESTSDEMCFNFILYHPATDFRSCVGDESVSGNFEANYPWLPGNEGLKSIDDGGSAVKTVLMVLIAAVVVFVLVGLPVFYLWRQRKQKRAATEALRGGLLLTSDFQPLEENELTVR